MRKRMLRSVLAAALSAVVALGIASDLVGKSSDVRVAGDGLVVAPAGGDVADDTSWN